MMATLYMETTQIPAARTAAQINELLGQAGAIRVMSEYHDGDVVAVFFQLVAEGGYLAYRLPIRVEAVQKLLLEKRRRVRNRAAVEEQAHRVAWRQAFRWLQAQLAFASTGMVELAEVMLPYLQVSPTECLYEQLKTKGKLLALSAP